MLAKAARRESAERGGGAKRRRLRKLRVHCGSAAAVEAAPEALQAVKQRLRALAGGRVRSRALVTVVCVLVYRAGYFKRLPGVGGEAGNRPLGDVMDFILPASESLTVARSGASVLSLGFTPYISASILVQILSSLDAVRQYRKEDASEATDALKQLTRLFTLAIALYQAFDVALKLKPLADLSAFSFSEAKFVWETTALLVAGACLVSHLAERVTEQGIGQGASVFISTSILSGFASSSVKLFNNFLAGNLAPVEFAACSAAFVAFIAGAILLTAGVVKVPMVFFQATSSNIPGVPKSPRGRDDHIPFKLNPLSMQPVLIALYVLQVPQWLANIAPGNVITTSLALLFSPGGAVYYVLLFTIVFAATFIDFEDFPSEINEYMLKIGARVPYVRPGSRSVEYFKRVQDGARFWGGLLLGGLATLAVALDNLLLVRFGTSFGLTSTLILVSTVLQIQRQILSLREDPRAQRSAQQL